MQDDLEQIVSDGPFSDVSVYSELESRQGLVNLLFCHSTSIPVHYFF